LDGCGVDGEIGKDVALCLMDGMDGGGDGEVSPLCVYPLVTLGDAGFSDWALHCVMDIYPILGISCASR